MAILPLKSVEDSSLPYLISLEFNDRVNLRFIGDIQNEMCVSSYICRSKAKERSLGSLDTFSSLH